MKLNMFAFSVPLFLSLMYIEYRWAKRDRKEGYFSLHNSIANLSIGIAERLCDILVTGAFYFLYDTLHKKLALFKIPENPYTWLLLLVITDFLWYWYHRLAHEVNILWGVHVVHHQSEDFNFTVSARISIFQALVRTLFWSALPILGFPPNMIITILLIHGIYPFFLHTQLPGKLGILEHIFVTPSHHRVHHCRNEEYLDKNYGDIFIFWDKLFGTYQTEVETIKPVFGLTKPLDSHSFLWQHFHFFIELWIATAKQRGWKAKAKILLGRLNSLSPVLRKEAESMFNIRHNNKADIPLKLNSYVLRQVVLLLTSLFLFILFEKYIPVRIKTLYSIVVLLTLINCNAVMEHKRWVFHVEYLRLVSFILFPLVCIANLSPLHLSCFIIPVVLPVLYYRTLQRQYLSIVYQSQ